MSVLGSVFMGLLGYEHSLGCTGECMFGKIGDSVSGIVFGYRVLCLLGVLYV